MEWHYQYHHVNGVQLHVGHLGMQNKKIIVFLHGFPEYSYGWKKQAIFFANQGYHVVAPDQRGYNLSSKPDGIKYYTLQYLIEDISELIQNIALSPVILVGHDWGGAVAWTVAQHYGHLIEKLIILNMPHPQVMKENLAKNSRQMIKSWYAAFFQLPVLPEIFCSALDFKWLESSLTSTSNENAFHADDIENYKKAWHQPMAVKSMINWYRAFKLNNLNIDLDVDVPTRIIWGAKDKFLEKSMASQSVDRCINGELIMLDELTHWLHHENPDQINELIFSFCNQQ